MSRNDEDKMTDKASEKYGGKLFLVEPGEVISLDEGRSWVLVTDIYEPPEEPEDVMMVTFSDGTRSKYESHKHILYPVYPREKEAAEKAKVTKGWVSLV